MSIFRNKIAVASVLTAIVLSVGWLGASLFQQWREGRARANASG
jgi:hypothetical protein